MLLHVTHETRYDYSPPVETAQHLAHLKPRITASQRLVSHTLSIVPPPAPVLDIFVPPAAPAPTR